MSLLETRTVTLDSRKLEGYAVRWNVWSQPLPMSGGRNFTEQVAPGAFSASLQTRGQALLWSHDHTRPLATIRSGSLELVEDAEGLRFKAALPDTSDGRDARALVEDGVMDQLSFGFRATRDTWAGSKRTLLQVDLIEISLVHDPAYPETSAALRSFSAAFRPDRRTALRLRLWRSMREHK